MLGFVFVTLDLPLGQEKQNWTDGDLKWFPLVFPLLASDKRVSLF